MQPLRLLHSIRGVGRRLFSSPSSTSAPLAVLNRITGVKEVVDIPSNGVIKWYSCGPTVYDSAHVGHARWTYFISSIRELTNFRNYVTLDIMRRVVEGYFRIPVHQIVNITDIDDKIVKRATELKVDWKDLAAKFELSFMQDMNRLGVLPPHGWTRVTQFIPEIISFTQRIMDAGFAYRTATGDVYFDTKKFGDRYRPLRVINKVTEASEDEGVGVNSAEADGGKKSVADFALWKSRRDGFPSWESPFGEGRPGWHIECSAMATETCGETIDIHTGGVDLCFPHHTNELAQSHAALGKDNWVKYLLHIGHVHIAGRKMSKSLKNFITVQDMLKDYTPNHFRLFCLLRQYADTVTYSPENMNEAVALSKKLSEFLSNVEQYVQTAYRTPTIAKWGKDEIDLMTTLNQSQRDLSTHLRNDFNTPSALDSLQSLVDHGNQYLRSVPASSLTVGALTASTQFVRSTLELFGLSFQSSKADDEMDAHDGIVDVLSQFRYGVRQAALSLPNGDAKKNILGLSDSVRDVLPAFGVRITDKKAELPTWKRLTSNDI